MKSAFNKDIIRSISKSAGRFLAIAIMAALGTGFFAGLRMTAPDMKLAGDVYYDGTNLCDLRVMGTLGFDDESIEQLRQIEGVEGIMPAREADVLALIDGTQYTVRIHSFDEDAAAASTTDGESVSSSDPDYINRPILVEGAWPQAENECVISADAVMDEPVKVGSTVTVVEGTQDVDDTFEVKKYQVTGFVRSSYYASSTALGSTSLGSGNIDQYMYVPNASFSDDLPYTEAFLTVAGAKDVRTDSEEYDQIVDAVADDIEAMAPELNAARYDEVKSEAQAELDKARKEFEDEKAKAEAQIADGEAELNGARAQLDSAKGQLDDAASQISSNKDQLASGWDEYNAGVKELADQRAAASQQFADAQAAIDNGWAQYNDAMAQRASLESQLVQVQAGIDAYPVKDPQDAGYAQLLGQKQAIEAGIAQIDAATAGVPEELAAAQAQLDAQKAAAENAFAQAEVDLADARAQLVSGQNQLSAGEREYRSGVAEYESGMAAYQSGRAEFEDQKATAESEFAKAERELADAQKEIDKIEVPELYVLDRDKNMGVASLEADADRIGRIAQVFPFLFFLVAALVSLTTMTRMVEEERVLIGTFKALGYSSLRITSKYLIYAIVASGIGSIVGILAFSKFLPWFIMEAYSIVYAVPPRPLPLDLGIALASAALGIGITVVATWFAAGATLHERPAALMLPRTPKAGKRIFLELIGPLWRRMSFSWKVTARNLFRYKRRFFMAVVGIAGCTSLLLTGLGLNNAINDIIDKQFGEIYGFNMTVRAAEDISDESAAQVVSTIEEGERVESFTRVHSDAMIGRSAEADSDYRFELVVPQNPDEFASYINVRDRKSQEALPLSSEGVVVSEKIMNELGLSEGDTISIFEEDEIGNVTGQGYELPVVGVMESYTAQYVLMTPELYDKTFGVSPAYVTLFAKATDDPAVREAMSDELLDIDGVKTVGYNDETIDSYRTMLKSVNAVVVVLVLAAAALAFVVLYNLTNINITERIREIATLKVLGFTPGEVNAYIYRETMLLSVIGALLGMVIGQFLAGFVVATAEVDQVMFGREIHAWSFAVAFFLTLGFSIIVNFAMRRKLANINMVESLKSVE